MIYEIKKLAAMLVALYGRDRGREIMLSAFRSLTPEERASLEIVLRVEEEVEAERVAEGLRKVLARALPLTTRRLLKKAKESQIHGR